MCVFFFKQKTAYEMRISDWSSDVCSSDLQFGWDVLPAAQDIPEDEAVAAPADAAADVLQTIAADEAMVLEGSPSTGAGSSIPPWSAAHPYVNLYTHKNPIDRKSVVSGQSVSVRVDLGGRSIIKKKK